MIQNSNFVFEKQISKYFYLLFAILCLANCLAFYNDILEPDGALYACISKNIAKSNNWVDLFGNGEPFLDKPHLPFWITALSFKCFGYNSFAYKFPSILCFLVGCFYLYKLTSLLYNKTIAQLALLVYAASLHVILANFDVRAEGYLTTFIIAATYFMYKALDAKKWFYSIAMAAIYIAAAMMTKGIFVLISIASGFVIYFIANRQWHHFTSSKWWILIALSFLLISPELYCLYMQFDKHPELLVFDTHGVSGIKFFFWDSQFGRFFNNGPIKGEGDILFFVHTMLWAFLPWAVILIFALVGFFVPKQKIVFNKSSILNAGAVTTFLLFSLSKFQLPHYIVIFFPHLSVIVAFFIIKLINNSKQAVIINNVSNFLLIILALFIGFVYKVFQLQVSIIFVCLLLIILLGLLLKYYHQNKFNVVIKSVVFATVLSVFLNLFFYPQLLNYQAGMVAGKWQYENYPTSRIVMYKCNIHSLEFYGNTAIKRYDSLPLLIKQNPNALISVTQKEYNTINKYFFEVKKLASFANFRVSMLDYSFFDASTRAGSVDSLFLITCSYK
jgi:4-amino-4-deoxy-L-arabinose transferase-like glycosyltransferase